MTHIAEQLRAFDWRHSAAEIASRQSSEALLHRRQGSQRLRKGDWPEHEFRNRTEARCESAAGSDVIYETVVRIRDPSARRPAYRRCIGDAGRRGVYPQRRRAGLAKKLFAHRCDGDTGRSRHADDGSMVPATASQACHGMAAQTAPGRHGNWRWRKRIRIPDAACERNDLAGGKPDQSIVRRLKRKRGIAGCG